MILATERAWGEQEFRLSSPVFRALARHAVWASKVGPWLNDAMDRRQQPIPSIDPSNRQSVAHARAVNEEREEARKRVVELRSLLDLPEPADG